MFLIEHCVPLMLWGAVAFAAGILCAFAAALLLLWGKACAEAEHVFATVLLPFGMLGIAVSPLLCAGGKAAFLLGVLGCVLSVFVKGV